MRDLDNNSINFGWDVNQTKHRKLLIIFFSILEKYILSQLQQSCKIYNKRYFIIYKITILILNLYVKIEESKKITKNNWYKAKI